MANSTVVITGKIKAGKTIEIRGIHYFCEWCGLYSAPEKIKCVHCNEKRI